MTFFTVLGRTLRKLSFFWNVYKDPSKFFKARALIFTFSFLFLCIWMPMWYYKVYLPDEGYEYPPLSKMNVDSGIWVFSHNKNKLHYVLTSDGRKILFNYHGSIQEYRTSHMEAQGLNPLSRFDPKIYVKVWWFSRPNTEANRIGQLEIEGKIVSTYENTYRHFLKSRDQSSYYGVFKFLGTLILTVLAWEFLVQYITYRQENN